MSYTVHSASITATSQYSRKGIIMKLLDLWSNLKLDTSGASFCSQLKTHTNSVISMEQERNKIICQLCVCNETTGDWGFSVMFPSFSGRTRRSPKPPNQQGPVKLSSLRPCSTPFSQMSPMWERWREGFSTSLTTSTQANCRLSVTLIR